MLKKPKISKKCFIHPTAVIIGDVTIRDNVFVGPLAVIRADEDGSKITIGDDCNIQDGVIIHALSNTQVNIGRKTSLSHGCVIHGPCKIGDRCFVGFKSVVFKSEILDDVFIKFSSVIEDVVVAEKRKIDSVLHINTSLLAKNLKQVTKDDQLFISKVISTNLSLLKKYKKEFSK